VDNLPAAVDRPSAVGDKLGTYVLFSLLGGPVAVPLDVTVEDDLTPDP
jgi:hypothetical protein